MRSFDPTELDRDLARAARAERAWLRRLRINPVDAGDEPWFEPVRWVTTRATFAELTSDGTADPAREPRRRWVYRLAMARIGQRARVEACRARASLLELEKPEVTTTAASEVVRRALADAERDRRAIWLEGLQLAGGRVQSAERLSGDAHREIAARLTSEPSHALTSPYDQATLEGECRALLAATSDLAEALFRPAEDLATLLGTLVCREVSGSWPGHLHARWLFESFARTPLLEGTALDLGPVPPLLGAATFVRALARFGSAWSRAASDQAGPYPVAQDATSAHPLRSGALFGMLVAEPAFLRRHLGFSRETARSVGRALAPTLLAQIRLDAVRTLFDLRALPVTDAREVLEDALKVRIAERLVGVLPRMGEGAPVRVAALLLGVGDATSLRDRFDEDWFDSPHALRALRESAAAPPPVWVPKEALEGTAVAHRAWIEGLASR